MRTETTHAGSLEHEGALLCSRRHLMRAAGGGLGNLVLAWMLHRDGFAAGDGHDHRRAAPAYPLAPGPTATAKHVIYLFMHGGPSQLETFDPKPDLQRLHGKPLPESFGRVETRTPGVASKPLLGTKRSFTRHGQSGIEVSDILPHIASCVDDMAVIRSCWADSLEHAQAVYLMNTGSTLMGKPCLGSWVCYGLGAENENLPAFVVIPHPKGELKGGSATYGPGFLPARYQATIFEGRKTPIRNLDLPESMTLERQSRMLELLGRLDRHHRRPRAVDVGREPRASDGEMEARLKAYELAYRMQSSARDAIRLSDESPGMKQSYGLDDPQTADVGSRCLLARRLVERGVRFVQVFCGDNYGWDAHSHVDANHRQMCAAVDQPIAALLRDLKSRGLLEETLVICAGEFGRTPMSESYEGRDHNPLGFSVWMAGGGIKGGTVHGATDAVGLRAVQDRVHVHDLHATILHLLGVDHTQLTFHFNGRDERLTDTGGKVIRAILA